MRISVFVNLRASLKMHFFRDSGVSSVLESSFTPRKLRLSGRCFLALTQKLLFLEVPLCATKVYRYFMKFLTPLLLLASLAGYIFYSLLIHLWSNEAIALLWWLLAGATLALSVKDSSARYSSASRKNSTSIL